MFHVKKKVSCTATIISPSWLLSSSSCISNITSSPQEWVVFAGPPTQQLDMEYTQIMIVRDILHHPAVRHHQHLVSPDLALVSLHHPFSFSQAEVGAVCLQEKEVQEQEDEGDLGGVWQLTKCRRGRGIRTWNDEGMRLYV